MPKQFRIFLGIAGVSGLAAMMVIPALFRAREEIRKAVCFSNLKQIGLAMEIYARDYGGKFPPALKDLVPAYLTDERVFHSLSDRSDKPSYLYVPGLTFKDSPLTMVVIERSSIHADGRHVLFVDTHVSWMEEGAFQAEWAQQQEKYNLPSLKDLGDTVEESR